MRNLNFLNVKKNNKPRDQLTKFSIVNEIWWPLFEINNFVCMFYVYILIYICQYNYRWVINKCIENLFENQSETYLYNTKAQK